MEQDINYQKILEAQRKEEEQLLKTKPEIRINGQLYKLRFDLYAFEHIEEQFGGIREAFNSLSPSGGGKILPVAKKLFAILANSQRNMDGLPENVTGGEITSGAKDSYAYGDSIIVTAGPAPEGKSFAGWYLDGVLVSTAEVYGRVIDRDLALEARFEDQPVEVKPTVVASSTPRVPVANSDNYKTSLSVSWSVPQGYALVEAGIYRAYAGSMPTAEKLLSKGTKKVSTLKNANGVYKLNVTMGSNKNVYGLYYIGYVTYKNASGQTLTEYSEIGCDPAIVLIS